MKNLPEEKSNTPDRITWKLLAQDVLDVVNFERGVFFTLKELILNPKNAVDSYFYDKRYLYANPLRFLLISTAIISFLNFYLVYKMTIQDELSDSNIEIVEAGKGKKDDVSVIVSVNKENDVNEDQLESDDEVNSESLHILELVYSWRDKFTLAMVPIFALFTFLFFRSSGYNFVENLVINAFLISVTNVMEIAFVGPTIWNKEIVGGIKFVVVSVFMIYFIYRVYGNKGFMGFFRSFIAFSLAYIVYFIMVVVVLISTLAIEASTGV